MRTAHFKILAIESKQQNLKRKLAATAVFLVVAGVSGHYFKEGAHASAHNPDGTSFSEVALTMGCLILLILSSISALSSVVSVATDGCKSGRQPAALKTVVTDPGENTRLLEETD